MFTNHKSKSNAFLWKNVQQVTDTIKNLNLSHHNGNRYSWKDGLHIETEPWGPSQYKVPCYQYKDSHYKARTASWPSFLQNVNPHTWKDSLYIEMGPCSCSCCCGVHSFTIHVCRRQRRMKVKCDQWILTSVNWFPMASQELPKQQLNHYFSPVVGPKYS